MPPEPPSDLVHYVTDGLESAVRQAQEAAGEADVTVHGADLAQSLLRARALDELEIYLVPVPRPARPCACQVGAAG